MIIKNIGEFARFAGQYQLIRANLPVTVIRANLPVNQWLYPKAIKVRESTFIALGWLGLSLFRNRGFMQIKVY